MNEKQATARNGDVELAYWVRGGGPTTVLLIMGINMRAAHWGERFVSRLAEHHRVIAFDNRGTGYSTKPVEDITAELWAEDAAAVLDAEGVERAHVIGTSMGGRIALQLAVDHPRRVERLVLVSGQPGGPRAPMPTPEALATFMPAPGKTPEQMRRDGITVVAGPGFAERDPEGFELLVALGEVKRTPLSVLQRQIRVAQTEVYDGMRTLSQPTLIVHGDADPLVPHAAGELAAELIPGAELVLLPGCGHFPAWEATEALLGALVPFLRP